jgi:hypothetical protein
MCIAGEWIRVSVGEWLERDDLFVFVMEPLLWTALG